MFVLCGLALLTVTLSASRPPTSFPWHFRQLEYVLANNDGDHMHSRNTESRKRIHFQTVLVVFGTVIVPWILVAIPGENARKNSSEDFTDEWRFERVLAHGWPAFHYVGRKFEPIPALVSFGAQKPQLDKLNQVPERPSNIFNLGMGKREFPGSEKFGNGFWTDINRWPSKYLHDQGPKSKIQLKGRILWEGLIINLSVVAILCILMGAMIEWRIGRRGRLFNITIAEALVGLLFVCVFLGWVHRCNRVSERQQVCGKGLSHSNWQMNIEQGVVMRREVIPKLVAKLFDFREPWPLRTDAWRPIKDYWIRIPSDLEIAKSNEQRENLSRILNEKSFRKLVSIELTENTASILSNIDPNAIDELDITVNNDKLPSLEFLKPFANRTSIAIHLLVSQSDTLDFSQLEHWPQVKHCSIWLEFSLTHQEMPQYWQNKYLSHVMNAKNVDSIVINNLNDEGAALLLSIPVGDRTVRFSRYNSNRSFVTLNRELTDQLVAAGYVEGTALNYKNTKR